MQCDGILLLTITWLLMSIMALEDVHGATVISAEDNEMKTVCKEESCFSCLANACTRFCTGAGCPQCLDGLQHCCQETTTVPYSSCLLCYGATCCGDITCNRCVATCAQPCIDNPSCYADCFNKCATQPQINHTTVKTSRGVVHSPRFNVTTTIRITNYINNTQHIDTPVYANHTNNQTVNVWDAIRTSQNRSGVLVQSKTNTTMPAVDKIKCCNVTHPRVCYPTTKGVRVCQFKRHVECSPLCKSKHVLIGPGNGTVQAIPITVPPFIYYGNYNVFDCLGCYSCGGSRPVEVCSKLPSCPKVCKENIHMEDGSTRHHFHQIVTIPEPARPAYHLPPHHQQQQQQPSYPPYYTRGGKAALYQGPLHTGMDAPQWRNPIYRIG